METKVRKYVKNPVVIEAVQWAGYNQDEIKRFCGDEAKFECRIIKASESGNTSLCNTELVIHTLEGNMHASIGDYIIRGVKGELYPCKPDIFNETYAAV